MVELTKRCQAYLMQQRGTIDSLLLAQKYNFDDVIRRCADHLKHNLNLNLLPNCGNTDPRLNELSLGNPMKQRCSRIETKAFIDSITTYQMNRSHHYHFLLLMVNHLILFLIPFLVIMNSSIP